MYDLFGVLNVQGIGSKLMEEKGWRKGKGLGKTASGITEPLEAEGQNPHCKTGLGYVRNDDG